jgi:3-isopropylmalate dehydrogenase
MNPENGLRNSLPSNTALPRTPARLTRSLPGWPAARPARCLIGILEGEGIGPEIMAAVVSILEVIAHHSACAFDLRYGGLIGKEAEKTHGQALTPEVIAWCELIFADGGAILCGPGGGRFVYEMRAVFDLYCKLTPVQPYAALHDIGVLRPAARERVDMIVVRENSSGLYFADSTQQTDSAGIRKVTSTFRYRADEVRRIIAVGVDLAQRRRRRLALVVKPNGIPAISELWIDIFNECVAHQNLITTILEVDNASYQLIAAAGDFDVVVAPNLFGDILSDNAALLLGSRGLSYSGNFGANGIATYQTGHGAAHDIKGKGIANPIGQLLAAAMMLRESFDLDWAAAAIDTAIAQVLTEDIRTPDIATRSATVVGTEAMGRAIAEAVTRELSRGGPAAEASPEH